MDIKTLQIQNCLVKTYKSATKIKMINHAKIKVEFNDKNEANLLPKDENLKLYRVYIPNDIVESEGVIQLSEKFQEIEHSVKHFWKNLKSPR